MMLQTANRLVLGAVPQMPRVSGRSARAGVRVQALQASSDKPYPAIGSGQPVSRARVLLLISELCEHNALVLKFETIAGRGAMIGVIVATTFELLVPRKGLFGGWQSSPGMSEDFAWLTFVLLALSAGLAIVSSRKGSQQLLEPVITSLTSTQRSIGSLSKKNVDKAVDYVLDSVFNQQMMRKHFPLDD